MRRSEKRRYRRLPLKLDLSCWKVGSAGEEFCCGRTVNVSPGGLYFESACGQFEPGEMLKMELSIPPAAGLLEFGGRISGFAKVLRTEAGQRDSDASQGGYGVAVEFCRSLKLHQ